MTHQDEQSFGRILISSRSLDEYRAMFGLSDADLERRILDCPSGAAGFTAEVSRRGGDVTGCDVAYFGNGVREVAAGAVAEAERGNRYVRANQSQYRWTFFADPDEHNRLRQQAAQRFAAHAHQDPERYVAGRLPTLPFADNDFELVLSSHLLFSYADDLDYDFHLRAILELMRVTTGELRIFPLVAIGASTRYPDMDELLIQLRAHGIEGRITTVAYEFQAGGNQMLVCRHTSTSRQLEKA
ncbi:hypothetical protein [Nocardia sp. XZ_19_385]|uniref:hypothetical protein n=1 Tax=Nocardia sp. XZ_19_385 TaxID=2769488 RepID=UPI00188F5310|nr:hypothetical protein [Nocardia sp. XZ_19_385]